MPMAKLVMVREFTLKFQQAFSKKKLKTMVVNMMVERFALE